jgi:dTDP-4-dehydrorhamnose 3,5-epimerase
MEFTETRLKGSFVVRPKRIEDPRGYFARAWCVDEFAAHGLNPGMLQLNVGFSHTKGTIRGMHFQRTPHAEAKFVRCTRGAVYDVIVDLRPGSITLGQWFGVELTAETRTMLYAPEGFAHGYQTLEDGAEIYYMTTARYAAASAGGVRYDDPALGIVWPYPASVISEQDKTWPGIQLPMSGGAR